jgi:hypothetical protein
MTHIQAWRQATSNLFKALSRRYWEQVKASNPTLYSKWERVNEEQQPSFLSAAWLNDTSDNKESDDSLIGTTGKENVIGDPEHDDSWIDTAGQEEVEDGVSADSVDAPYKADNPEDNTDPNRPYHFKTSRITKHSEGTRCPECESDVIFAVNLLDYIPSLMPSLTSSMTQLETEMKTTPNMEKKKKKQPPKSRGYVQATRHHAGSGCFIWSIGLQSYQPKRSLTPQDLITRCLAVGVLKHPLTLDDVRSFSSLAKILKDRFEGACTNAGSIALYKNRAFAMTEASKSTLGDITYKDANHKKSQQYRQNKAMFIASMVRIIGLIQKEFFLGLSSESKRLDFEKLTAAQFLNALNGSMSNHTMLWDHNIFAPNIRGVLPSEYAPPTELPPTGA